MKEVKWSGQLVSETITISCLFILTIYEMFFFVAGNGPLTCQISSLLGFKVAKWHDRLTTLNDRWHHFQKKNCHDNFASFFEKHICNQSSKN